MDALIDSIRDRLGSDPPPSEPALALELYTALKDAPDHSPDILNDSLDLIGRQRGIQCALNVLSRCQVALGYRKPSLGLYDNALHFIGGAQKYGCTLAHALQSTFEVTLLSNADVSQHQLEDWYNLDLSQCRIKTVRMPFFEEKEQVKGIFDAGLVDLRGDNPFHAVSLESGAYDVFVNNCMLEMVYPLSPLSEFVVHFPERERSRFFHVHQYTHIIFNSLYTAEWIQKRWNIKPHAHIYPPVDMVSPLEKALGLKQNIILSVARFEPGGNKQQAEMIKAFTLMRRRWPRETEGWRLVLAGGSTAVNPYLDRIRSLLVESSGSDIELLVNLPVDQLKKVFQSARLFWHFSGLGQRDPARIEHFGMTTVEAMQCGCVPVVFRGGGQKEIVVQETSGFLFDTIQELLEKTLALIQKPELVLKLARNSHARGKVFVREVFESRVKEHFAGLLQEYRFQDKERI
jgi:glycosyltransferase involved in cell wall biosynthesis